MRATVKEQFKKIDRLVYQVERMFVVSALIVMSAVVFLDVVHRTFASEENKGVTAFVKFLSYFGPTIERDSSTYAALETYVPYGLWIAFVGLGFLGLRTAKLRTKIPAGRALLFSAAGVIGVYGLIRLFVMLMPNGLIWSSRLALVLTLWVGFVAASMCTHENKHLKVEAAQRAIPDKFKPFVVFLSAMFTALVCFALMWLAARYCVEKYEAYQETEGRGALVEGLGLPLYVAFAVLPLSFATMTTRFGVRALFALGGELPVPPSLEGFDQLEKQQREAAEAERPSDVPTEVGSEPDVPKLQSKVATDRHESAAGSAKKAATKKAAPASADESSDDSADDSSDEQEAKQ